MRKVIAKLLALIVCIFAVVVIYYGVHNSYEKESMRDFITEGEKFSQGQLVDPTNVEAKIADGKLVHALANYWRNFQDLNNEMDTETNKMLGAFEAKNLSSKESISNSLSRMSNYQAIINKDSDGIEKNAKSFSTIISKLNQEEMKYGHVNEFVVMVDQEKDFRASIAGFRKTIASYSNSALQFLASRQGTIKVADNGAISFANAEDQKYFYGLMDVIKQSDAALRTELAENRNKIRTYVAQVKKVMQN